MQPIPHWPVSERHCTTFSPSEGHAMQRKMRHFLTIVSTSGLGLMLSLQGALAEDLFGGLGKKRHEQSFKELSAQWQQWRLSIPTPENPLLDPTGEHCMVGQRGAVWFLAGTSGGGAVTRA